MPGEATLNQSAYCTSELPHPPCGRPLPLRGGEGRGEGASRVHGWGRRTFLRNLFGASFGHAEVSGMFVNDAVLHDKADVAYRFDVGRWISSNSDQVSD